MKKSNKKALAIISIILVVFLIAGAIIFFVGILPNIKAEKEHQEKVKLYFSQKLALYEQENALYSDYEVDVAFLGDSLTDLYDLEKYYPQYLTANRGIGGDTTFGLEQRLKVSVFDLKPKVAVMLIGANNMDSMFDNYENILISLKQNLPNTKVVLLSLTAMGGKLWGSKNQLACYNNVKIELLAQKYGFYFVDLYTPLFDVNIGEVYDGYTVDGGHFTHQGYQVVTAHVTPILQSILGK